VLLYSLCSEQRTETAEQRQKYETGQAVGVNPSMSVKRFLDKYFGSSDSNSNSDTVQPSPSFPPSVRRFPTPTPTPSASLSVSASTGEQNPHTFHIFTDGACSDNGRKGAKGGFGVHFYSKKGSGLDISQRLMKTEQQTNNRGELRAIQAALDMIDKYDAQWSQEYNDYCIWSDSEYSINCLTKWSTGWRRNGWKKSDGAPIQNIDLIKPVYEKLVKMPKVRLHHVRAHQRGREHEFPYDGNTEADRLARVSIVQPYL
jgi:ribonuclease HI